MTCAWMLKISGQRGSNGTTTRGFDKEISIPSDCDTNYMITNLEDDILEIKLRKLMNHNSHESPETDEEGAKLEDSDDDYTQKEKEHGASKFIGYEDINQMFEWFTDHNSHILSVMVPGLRRDQLKVQVTVPVKVQGTLTSILKISVERQISGNNWRRICKKFSFPSDCDTNDISAKLEGGTLKIKFPKHITPTSESSERDEHDDIKNGAKPGDQPSDDEVSVDFTKEKRENDNVDCQTDAVNQEKAKKTGQVSGKTSPTKHKEKEAAAAEAEAYHEKQRTKNVTRLKTRFLVFTLSVRPSPDGQEDYKEAVAGLVTESKKMKNLMNLMMVTLLVVVFVVLYVKDAFQSSLRGSKEMT